VPFRLPLLLAALLPVLLFPAAQIGPTGAYVIWDPSNYYPPDAVIPFLPVVTHVTIERTTSDGFRYLHEPAIAFHKGVLHAIWASGPSELNFTHEMVRGSRSTDGGLTWSTPRVIAPGHATLSHNHPSMFTHQGKLWIFATRFDQESPRTPVMVGFEWDEQTDTYKPLGVLAREFVVFDTPKRMKDGNWVLAGEKSFNTQPRVLISKGDDLTRWTPVDIPIPEGTKLVTPETTVLVGDAELITITRNSNHGMALASESRDFGRTWSTAVISNYPMAPSKPIGGTLSTSQRFLIANSADDGRKLLSIAVSRPGEKLLSKVWKIRHQAYPMVRSPSGVNLPSRERETQWSYPAAVEANGNLYVIYSVGKEDCELSIIPLRALRLD
jgi:hypothetical protein